MLTDEQIKRFVQNRPDMAQAIHHDIIPMGAFLELARAIESAVRQSPALRDPDPRLERAQRTMDARFQSASLDKLRDRGAATGAETDRWKHLKTGGIYEVLIDNALMEATGLPAVVYRGADGRVWVRPRSEFLGRFERIALRTDQQVGAKP